MSSHSVASWMPYISSVISKANARCVVNTEAKEGASRTCLLRVWNYPMSGQPPKVVLLIGFNRSSQLVDTTADIAAQALVSDYNPPYGWSGRIVWIVVLDPFSNQWIISKCQEQFTGLGPEAKEFSRHPVTPDTEIVIALQTALTQNIATYG